MVLYKNKNSIQNQKPHNKQYCIVDWETHKNNIFLEYNTKYMIDNNNNSKEKRVRVLYTHPSSQQKKTYILNMPKDIEKQHPN